MNAKQKTVLAPDNLNQKGRDAFQKAGILVEVPPSKDPKLLMDIIPSFNCVIVRSATKMTRELIEAGASGRLEIVGRAGVGFDNIDLDAATNCGIVVKNAPMGNTVSTAELAVFLMGSVARNIMEAHLALKAGRWEKKKFQGMELQHKTLGIIGCGRIGSAVAKRAAGFDMRIIGFDPYSKNNPLITYVSKQELLETADFITIHSSAKQLMIGRDELAAMKKSAYLINAARGLHVDPDALHDALKAEKIAGAALDVHVGEPRTDGVPFKSMFSEFPNVLLTPHLGASTKEAQEMTALEMAAVIIGYLKHGDFTNAVNCVLAEESKEITYPIRVFHADKAGMFSKIGEVLAQYGINILEIISKPFKPQKGEEGAQKHAASTFLTYQPPTEEALAQIRAVEGVKRVMAETAEEAQED